MCDVDTSFCLNMARSRGGLDVHRRWTALTKKKLRLSYVHSRHRTISQHE